MKRLIVFALLLLVAAAGGWYGLRSTSQAATSFRLVTVERATVEKTITATGTLEPRTTVEVGTQVSGQISEILVDFNDPVSKGQVIARIDPQNLEMAVSQAKIALRKATADLADRQREADRIERLHAQDLAAEIDRTAALYQLEVAGASFEAAQIDLERAEQNLDYATIRAPISGVVVERLVDVGQTVAASLSAPQLFLIAADLSEMRILATVDESDVGQIHEGQTAKFTVQAYPEAPFEGLVRQIRLQPTSQDNVVSYTVVVEVDNARDDAQLLPGMTATVDFVVETEADALTVANAALRFRPSEELLATARENTDASEVGLGKAAAMDSGSTAERARILYLDQDGRAKMARVRVGVSNGDVTAIGSDVLEPGMSVIAGTSSGGTASNTSQNPFNQSSASSSRRGPPGGF